MAQRRRRIHAARNLTQAEAVWLSTLTNGMEPNMDRDRTEGAAQKTGGRVKEAAGKLMGDSKLEMEGKKDKAAGSVKNAIGGMKDALRDADRRH